jgi:hypothetical protein
LIAHGVAKRVGALRADRQVLRGLDLEAVVDVEPSSSTYGQIVHRTEVFQ